MSKPIFMSAAEAVQLQSSPISRDWVIQGNPETRSKELTRSADKTCYAMVWECTAGVFNWHYNKDEGLVVISGEAFISHGETPERRIGPGDFVFFPAGTLAKWRVPQFIKKVAYLRHTMPRPAGYGVLAWNLLLRLLKGGGGGL